MVLSGQIAKRTREGERMVGKSISSVPKVFLFIFIYLFSYLVIYSILFHLSLLKFIMLLTLVGYLIVTINILRQFSFFLFFFFTSVFTLYNSFSFIC